VLFELTLHLPQPGFTLGDAVVDFGHLVGSRRRCIPGQPAKFRVTPAQLPLQPSLFGDEFCPLSLELLLGLPEHLRPQDAVAANGPNLVDHDPLDFTGGQRRGWAGPVAILDGPRAGVVAISSLPFAGECMGHRPAAGFAVQQSPEQCPILVPHRHTA